MAFLVGKPVLADNNSVNTVADYATYFNVFDDGSSGINIPTNPLLQDATTKTVKGFTVNITLGFSSNDSDFISSRWDYVKDDSSFASTPDKNDTFLVRVCDNSDKTHCWINTIPYDNSANQEDFSLDGTIAITHFQTGAGNILAKNIWRNPIQLNNFPILQPKKLGQITNGLMYGYASDGKGGGATSDFPSEGVKLPTPSSLNASLWYCARNTGDAKNPDGSKAYSVIGSNNDTVSVFGKLCGGSSYFRIGSVATITIPANAQDVTNQTNTQQATSGGGTNKSNLPECGISLLGSHSGTVSGCAAQLAYGIYQLTAWIAGLFGKLFDFFIGYSLSDKSYRYDFAVTGWKLVRDISNVFFIIILVWTGFSAIFDSSVSMKKVVPSLIVNALLINFSLFTTRVVIDISNITARMFYSEMLVCKQENIDKNGNCPPEKAERDAYGYWPLSEKIVSAFNPQKIFSTNILQTPNYSSTTTITGDHLDATRAGNVGSVPSEIDYAIYFGIVCIIASVIMVFIGIMFFKVAFLFVGRVVGLYICMIFSPFAFLSRDIPILGGVKRLRWNDWWSDLASYAMLAPVFIFFLYIIYTLLSSNFAQQIGVSGSSDGSFFGTVIAIAIPMAIIFYLMKAAQSAAVSLSGDIGKSIQGFGEKLTGLAAGTAVGVATGGAGFLGRNIVGRGIGAIGNNVKTGKTLMVDGKEVKETLAMRLASRSADSWFARQQNKAFRWTQTSSWNPGNASAKVGGKDYSVRDGVSKGLGVFGVKTNNLVENLGYVGNKAGEGGNIAVDKKRNEERQKELEDRIKLDHLTDDQAKAVWEKYKSDRLNKISDKKWKDNIEEEATIKPVAKDLKDATDNLAKLKKERDDIDDQLSTARINGRTGDITTLENQKVDKEKEISDTEQTKTTLTAKIEGLKTNRIKEIEKSGNIRDTAAYKKAQTNEQQRLDRYGKIKNAKNLTTAMRSEHAEDLKESSWWLKDGKARWDTPIYGIAAAAISAAIPVVGPLISALILKEMATGISRNAFGDINKKAVEKVIGSYKTSQGKGNKEERLSGELETINDFITKAMKEHYKDALPAGKIDDWTEDEIEKGIAGKTLKIQDEIIALQEKIRTETDAEEKRKQQVNAAVLKKQIEKYKKILEHKERVQNELDKVKADNKKKEDEAKK